MAAPYDNLETIVSATRVKVNDAIASINGDVFTDNQPFTIYFINNAWRRLQSALLAVGYVGFARLKEEVILNAVPAIGSADWGSQLQLSWTSTPALPQDFIAPLKLWERPTGYQFGFLLMDRTPNGIPSAPKQSRNIVWDWRDDQINLPGTTVAFDLRVRYQAYLADFVSAATTAFIGQTVPIMRCLNPFADFIAYELSLSRADLDSQAFMTAAQAGLQEIISGDTAQARSIAKMSEFGKMKDADAAEVAQ